MAVMKMSKRTSRANKIILCLFVACVTLPASRSQLSLNEVTFLGYVTPSNDPNDLSALIQVDGAFESRRHSWRASLRRDDCGGIENDDFFVVKELADVGDVRIDTGGESQKLQPLSS